MLEFLEDLGQQKAGNRNRHFYLVKCSYCGREFPLRADRYGKAYQCGCLRKEIGIRNVSKHHSHKMSGTRLYHIWQGIKSRCGNPNNTRYKNYGGRGITICDEWVDFENFKEWALSHGYQENLTIERKDTNGDYEPDNCTFTATYYQNRNRTSNVVIGGKCLTDWALESGLNVSTVFARYKRGDRDLSSLLRPVWSRKTTPR